jgi:hypothetical protein
MTTVVEDELRYWLARAAYGQVVCIGLMQHELSSSLSPPTLNLGIRAKPCSINGGWIDPDSHET